jgi:hypothetical protein
MEVLIWVVAVTGALASSFIASLFLAAGLQTMLHRAYGAVLAIHAAADEDYEAWQKSIKGMDATVASSLFLSTVFYGLAVYLIWGV